MQQFQVTGCEAVKPYVSVFLDAGDGTNMLQFVVMGFRQVMQGCPCGNDGFFKFLYAKTFQRPGAEVL